MIDDPITNNAVMSDERSVPLVVGSGSPVRGWAMDSASFVIARDRPGSVTLLDRASGRALWTWKSRNWIHSNPRIVDDMVIVGYGDSMIGFEMYKGVMLPKSGQGPGGVAALDLKTGILRWTFDAGGSVMTSPIIVDSTVYALTGRAELVMLRLRDGALEGRERVPGVASMSNPHYADGAIVFGFSLRTGLARFDLDTHRFRWIAPLDSTPVGVGDVTPAIIGNQIVTTASTLMKGRDFVRADALPFVARRIAMKLHRLPYAMLGEQFVIGTDACTGAPRWKRSLGLGWQANENRSGMPVTLGDAIFISSVITNSVYRLDTDGHVAWTRGLDAPAIGGVVATPKGVIAAQRNGTIVVLDPRTGVPLRSIPGPPIRAFAPVLTGRVLLVPRADGTITELPRTTLLGPE